MRNIIKLSALLAFAVFCGCKDTNTTQVIYTGDAIPGTLVGNGNLYDTVWDNFSRNYAEIDDRSNVLVSLEGTTFKTTTNKKGEWRIENVPPGTYNILFQKDDYIIVF